MINDTEAATLLRRMVAIPSINPAFRQPGDPDEWFGEAAMAAFVADWLREAALAVTIETVEPGRPNVVARLRGSGGGRSMLWEGHLDTVQVTGMAAPFAPRLDAGRLYARGAVDDKGCVAAFMLAMRELAEQPPPGDVTFLAAIDEEYNFAGVRHHLEHGGGSYELGVAGEPTDLRVVRACKGCVRWHVELLGRAAHTSKPHEGVDAIAIARRVLARFEAEMDGRTRAHALLGRATLTCTAFEAGVGPNTVPPRAMLRFDYRCLPGEAGAAVWQDFKRLAEESVAGIAGAGVAVHKPFIDSSAMDVPADSAIVVLFGKVCERHGIDPAPLGVPFGSDASKMVGLGGIPTVVFGPGNIDQAHAADEYVPIAEVAKAARMLVDLARRASD
jgi:succinyl-diaminopimelate desuccinylase